MAALKVIGGRTRKVTSRRISMNYVFPSLLFMLLMSCGTTVAAVDLWYSVIEQQPAGTVVGNVKANLSSAFNNDENIINNLNFRSFARNSASLFTIDNSTGIIRTVKAIDRDLVCSAVTQCTVRYDVAVFPVPNIQTMIVKVFVSIIDVNDNVPTFYAKRIALQISESTPAGASYVIPTAHDGDSPAYNIKRYLLANDYGKFTLRVTKTDSVVDDVKLVLISMLNAESIDSYELTVIASDCDVSDVLINKSCHSASLYVDVKVLDVNDNYPVFDKASYWATVREDAPLGAIILQMRVVDNDQEANSLVSCRITTPDVANVFYMKNDTMTDYDVVDILLARPLSYIDTPSYVFTVTACDSGTPRLCNDVKVTVDVIPVIRSAPKIQVNTISAADVTSLSLREDAPVGAFVAQVIATDDTDVNSVFCSLLNSPYFSLLGDRGEYSIITLQQLPRNKYTVVQLPIRIVCSNNASNSLISSKLINVTLQHINEPPYFSKSLFVGHITENNDVGASVLQLQAADVDGGADGAIRFIYPKSIEKYFTLDQSTGLITAAASLNTEVTPLFVFNVSVLDGGSPPLSDEATVVIAITDVNDEKPTFVQKKYLFSIRENCTRGDLVGTVSAVDIDSSRFNNISYSLTGNSNDLFAIDSISGNITVKRTLFSKGAYFLTVKATDIENPRFTDTASIIVVTDDGTDQNPRFIFPSDGNNTIRISAQTPINYVIATLRALNADTSNSDRLIYSILHGNEDEMFSLDSLSGALSVSAPFEVTSSKTYDLVLEVMDSIITSRKSQSICHVVVNNSIHWAATLQLSDSWKPNFLVMIIVASATGLFIVIFIIIIVAMFRRRPASRRRRRSIIITKMNEFDKVQSSFSCDVADEASSLSTTMFLRNDWNGRDRCGGGSIGYSTGSIASTSSHCKMCTCTRRDTETSKNSLEVVCEVMAIDFYRVLTIDYVYSNKRL